MLVGPKRVRLTARYPAQTEHTLPPQEGKFVP